MISEFGLGAIAFFKEQFGYGWQNPYLHLKKAQSHAFKMGRSVKGFLKIEATFHQFLMLPSEIQLTVLSYLGIADLGRVACVSKAIKLFAQDDLIWKPFIEKDCPTIENEKVAKRIVREVLIRKKEGLITFVQKVSKQAKSIKSPFEEWAPSYRGATFHQLFNLTGEWIKSNHLWDMSALEMRSCRLFYFPIHVCDLSLLISLDLSDNRIQRLGNLSRLVYLQTLILKGNLLSALDETFSDLENLTSLDISDNRFTKLPEIISQLKKLKTLRYEGNPIDSPAICKPLAN